MVAITWDTLADVRLFSGLKRHDLERIAKLFTVREFPAGRIILPRDEPALELYVILSGRVRVELLDRAGQTLVLTEFGFGKVVGERAILTDEKRSADVRAITGVRAARLARGDFEQLLQEIPLLYANLCQILAAQLGSWAHRHRREESEHREVITNVIGWQLLPEFGAFPGASAWVRLLNRRLQHLADTRSAVLILGEPGTWKDLAARLIHFHGDAARPVLFMDCAAPPPLVNGEEPSGDSAVLLGMAQEAALFGHAPEGGAYARRVRRGMIELAAGGDIILRNVECLTEPVQEALVAYLALGEFTRRGESRLRSASVRLIATSGKPLRFLAENGRFSAPLYQRLSGETVELLPLRERKKDIPVIARSLLGSLNAKHNRKVQRLSQDALNLLVDHDWPLNTTELYQVVSRAVVVCNDETIQPEHISLQGHPFGGGRFNLLTLPAVERAAADQRFPGLIRWVTVPIFLAAVLYTLFGPRTNNPANLAAWTIGWPALIVTAFLGARGWCSFCPLEAIGAYLGVTSGVVRDPAPWLRRWGPWASCAALVLILLVEQATGMFADALATGLLLSGILLATVSADLLIGRRGWCKYLCPLGRVVSLVSRISPLEMHSNHNVCLSRCRVDDCIKEKACPMGLHPTGIDSSDHCILCFNCVRSCPHHSMQLDLRDPTSGVYQKARRGLKEAVFSVTLVGAVLGAKLTPLLVAPSADTFSVPLWSATEWLVAGGIVLGFFGVVWAASAGVSGARCRGVFTTSGLAYLPFAAAGLFLIYFRQLVEEGARLIPLLLADSGLDQVLDAGTLTPELGTLRLFIVPIIVMAALFSWVVLGRLHQQDGLPPAATTRHRFLLALTAVAFVVCL